MKRLLVIPAAVAVLAFGTPVPPALSGGSLSAIAANGSITADAADLSAAKKKKKKATRRAGSGASKAGTGGGAGGESGSGSAARGAQGR